MTPSTDLQAAITTASRALEAHDPQAAFAALTPYAGQVTEDRDLALTWLTLLRITPGRDGLQEDVKRIIARWSEDPLVVIAGCDALVRAAELQPADEPPPAHGPAELAGFAAEHCLERLDVPARKDPKRGGYLWMNRANAMRLMHRHDDARFAYEAALATDPSNGQWWFNFGLLHKAARNFAEGVTANQRARELLGDQKGVLWNLAICATATGQADLAIEVMQRLGFPATKAASGMPVVEGLPPMQVRAAAIGSGHGSDDAQIDRAVFFELVWVSPLSPCHGVVTSTTHRDAAIDYGDVVLWDATPVGVVEHEGKRVPRFPLLSVLRQGDERRYRFVALEQHEGEIQKLASDLPDDALLFPHRAQVEMLCARCASGDHMRKHAHTAPEPHRLVYGKLVIPASADLKAFRRALDDRIRKQQTVSVVVPGLLEALGDTEAAGKAHQLWRGLEQRAMKMTRQAPSA
jgi:hypothetical protein